MRKPARAVAEAVVESPPEPASGPTSGRSVGVLDVVCRYCKAAPGQPCWAIMPDKAGAGGIPRREGPHKSRENDPTVLRWAAWHGDKGAGQKVPPL
jgi:hypothetical protein